MKRLRRVIGTVTVSGAVAVCLTVTFSANASVPPTPSGWNLVWSDDFSGAAGSPLNGANTVWGTLHCGVSPGGPCNETSGIGGNRACPGATCQSAFHTYAIEWDRSVSPQQIRWYVDGQQYHQVSQSQVDATTWANAT